MKLARRSEKDASESVEVDEISIAAGQWGGDGAHSSHSVQLVRYSVLQ